MGALVDFEILGPGEHLAASLERARERFLAGVHPDVVDQLVLGLERPALALATVPEARVRRALGPADVLDRDVRHDVLHGAEHFTARAHRRPRLVDPQARHVLERGGRGRHGHAVPHVPVKRTAAGRTVVAGTAARAVRVLRTAAAVLVAVPVHGSDGRGRDGRLCGRCRRRRVHLSVVVMVVMVRLQIVVHAGVQAAEVMVLAGAVLVMVTVVMVVHLPADLQKVPGPRVPGVVRRRWQRRRRLPVAVHVMVLILRRTHVIVLDLDAHAVGQRRVVHKRV